ncbi:hypothetical protein Hanom_Chr00s000006g01613871 [Helianthus anomalus]
MCYTIDSQSSTILEPTFQTDQLHDPADFLQPMRSSKRRTSYQHHVYSSQPENDVLSSQEACKILFT